MSAEQPPTYTGILERFPGWVSVVFAVVVAVIFVGALSLSLPTGDHH